FRATALGTRDLLGEIIQAARADGLAVLARMDSSRAHEDLYNAHPEWFGVDSNGKAYRAGDLYITCINSPYFRGYLPDVLREISERYKPDGFADNSWSGLGRDQICYCDNCDNQFRDRNGRYLPQRKDWD